MNANVCAKQTLRTLAAICLLTLVCISSAAEPLIIEMDLPDLGVIEKASDYIVQAADVDSAAEAVQKVGGTVTDRIGMMQAVRATLLPAQVELLRRRSDVLRVFEDTATKTSSDTTPKTKARSSEIRPS